MQMRVAGFSRQEIARALEINISAVARALARSPDPLSPDCQQQIRLLECERLDALMQAAWPAAMAGDIRAGLYILEIMKRRSAFLGLDLVGRPLLAPGEAPSASLARALPSSGADLAVRLVQEVALRYPEALAAAGAPAPAAPAATSASTEVQTWDETKLVWK
jgi:hypothetical protein